jgi:glycine hydroxymethyltransferase
VTFTTYKTLRAGRGGVILCKHEHARKITKTIFPGSQGTPSLNLMAAKAVCFNLAMTPEFKMLQENILANARLLATEFERMGYRIVSGGTDNHIVLLDLRPKGITGKDAEEVLESVGIVVNRNVIPGDPERPDITSGIRIGSAAAASRGMGSEEMVQIATLVDKALVKRSASNARSEITSAVADLCSRFPVYGVN